MKHRLFVLTDITSNEAGVREPDDAQSMVRLMLYANQLDLEGLAACSNLEHGQLCRPELINQIVDAYAEDYPKLHVHDPAYPDPAMLRGLISSGQPIAGRKIPVEASIGHGKDTDASHRLIAAVDHDDPRPLWVAVWGGTADLAQALLHVRHTRSAEALRTFVSRIRVHAVNDQDTTGPWIRENFPDLFYITRKLGIRGWYRGGDMSLVSSEWVQKHIKPCGALGRLYPDYRGGDIWSGTMGPVHGIKEGDTPSWINLVGPDPLSGWGGTLTEVSPNRWDDAPAPCPPDPADPDPRMINIHRYRSTYQADFARRLAFLR